MLKNVIHDHDGHIDDLISLGMLATAHNKNLVATTLVPADSYLEPATQAVEKLLTLLDKTSVHFAHLDNEGPNPFPHNFRKDSNKLPEMPVFSKVKSHKVRVDSELTAPEYLAQTLNGTKNYEVVETGPLTNIAEALKINPNISKSISNLFFMGGALEVAGNVRNEPGHDGSAEWNVYNNPSAANEVLHSGIPITLVSLDITNEFPVTHALVEKVNKQTKFALSQMACESWKIILENPAQSGTYFMWDILTTAICLNPDLFDYKTQKISIEVKGASSGRTRIDPHGIEVQIPLLRNRNVVEEFIIECLNIAVPLAREQDGASF